MKPIFPLHKTRTISSEQSPSYPIPISQKIAEERLKECGDNVKDPEKLLAKNYPQLVSRKRKRSEKDKKIAEKRILNMDFEDVTVAELKHLLRLLGKDAIGKKNILMERIMEEYRRIKGDDTSSTLPEKAGSCQTDTLSLPLDQTLLPHENGTASLQADLSQKNLLSRSRSYSAPLKSPALTAFTPWLETTPDNQNHYQSDRTHVIQGSFDFSFPNDFHL
jgi:hypothetical protein